MLQMVCLKVFYYDVIVSSKSLSKSVIIVSYYLSCFNCKLQN